MEEKEKIQFHIHDGAGIQNPVEIIFREGMAARPIESLPIKEPERISVSGVITAPADWLCKRVGTIDQLRANVRVNREKMHIELTVNSFRLEQAIS